MPDRPGGMLRPTTPGKPYSRAITVPSRMAGPQPTARRDACCCDPDRTLVPGEHSALLAVISAVRPLRGAAENRLGRPVDITFRCSQ